MNENQTIEQEFEQLTPEELDARKKEMLSFYKEQIEFLEVQKQYESLAADVEEARLRRLIVMLKRAEIEQPRTLQPESDEEMEPQPRKLRKS
jgi:hypothetical protein